VGLVAALAASALFPRRTRACEKDVRKRRL
jgi:hypothetical protein